METLKQTTNNNTLESLASWERPRSTNELLGFLSLREAACDVEDFEF